MTIIFKNIADGADIGIWDDWQGIIPNIGDIIYDATWYENSFTACYIDARVVRRKIIVGNPDKIYIYLKESWK